MKNILKYSVDWDGTFDLVKHHIKRWNLNPHFECHIVTTRNESGDNQDIISVLDFYNIKREHLHFTNDEWKVTFFKDKSDFLFHIDDVFYECILIGNQLQYPKPFCITSLSDIIEKVEKLIQNWELSFLY